VRKYADGWLKDRMHRDLETYRDDEARLNQHVLPALGHVVLADWEPRHTQEFVRGLKKKESKRTGKVLAPRTVRHIYTVIRQLAHDAQADGKLMRDPCILKRGDLPPKKDRNPNWRPTAVFSTPEVELLISDERIPLDRRVWYALHFLTGMRPGEGAALLWGDYDTRAEPLGRLAVSKAMDRKRKRVKGTKTETTRYLPVHPALASLLAEWKLSGWQNMLREWRALKRLEDRGPGLDDMIIPSRRGAPRSNSLVLKRFYEDLDRVGLRKRRAYDTRRTFTSLTRAAGARKDLIDWLTHPPTDMTSQYTTFPWETLCEAVSCWRVERLEGQLLRMAGDSPGTVDRGQEKTAVPTNGYGGGDWRGVRDSKLCPQAPGGSWQKSASRGDAGLRKSDSAATKIGSSRTVPAVPGRRKRGGLGGRSRAVAISIRPRSDGGR